jgi:hypothetical protein
MKYKILVVTIAVFALFMRSYSQTRLRNNMKGVLQRLNDSLKKYDEAGRTVQLLSDSVFAVKNKNGSYVTVNILKLRTSQVDSFHRGGIDFIPVDTRTHAPANWIYFQQQDQTTRLKFEKATVSQAKRLYYLFVDLRWYMQSILRQLRS